MDRRGGLPPGGGSGAAGTHDRRIARAAALELYPGPLLPEDLYEAWTEPMRAELDGLREELASLAADSVADAEAVTARAATTCPSS